jgi:BirA family biotin operon repressor/biotin-[acetyl-CoA-carboxylase] ligase
VPTATSLALAGGRVDRTELFGQVLRELRVRLGALMRSPHGLVASYRPLCDTLGRDVRVDLPGGAVLQGRAEDIDEHGRLVVVPAAGAEVAVAAGDVVHVRPRE